MADIKEMIDRITARAQGGVTIHYNEHKNYYDSVRRYIEGTEWMSKAVPEDLDYDKDLWEVYVYPDTPGAFYHTMSNDLETALIKMMKILELT